MTPSSVALDMSPVRVAYPMAISVRASASHSMCSNHDVRSLSMTIFTRHPHRVAVQGDEATAYEDAYSDDDPHHVFSISVLTCAYQMCMFHVPIQLHEFGTLERPPGLP